MSRTTTYEWVVESIDEHGDVQDLDFWDTYAEARRAAAGPGPGIARVEVGLVRSVWRDDGELLRRGYAYLDEGELPEAFDDGARVPQRFRKEVP